MSSTLNLSLKDLQTLVQSRAYNVDIAYGDKSAALLRVKELKNLLSAAEQILLGERQMFVSEALAIELKED